MFQRDIPKFRDDGAYGPCETDRPAISRPAACEAPVQTAVDAKAAFFVSAEATFPDTFEGAGEVAFQVIQRLASVRLNKAARSLERGDLRAVLTR